MAARYWVGGSATWDATAGTKWALTSGGAGGQAVPTSADDVFFDAASGAVTCTLSGNLNAKSITCTGFTGTLTGNPNLNIFGNLTLVSGMTFSMSGANIGIKAAGTITSAGKSLGNGFDFDPTTGTITLADAFTANQVRVLSGTFQTNNFNFTGTSSIQLGGSSTVSLGSSTVTTSSFTDLGSTVTAGTSTLNIGSSFSSPTKTWPTVNFTSPGGTLTGSGTVTITSLTFPAPGATGLYEIIFGTNYTVGTLVCSGSAANQRYFMRSDTLGTSRSLSVTTWSTISDIDFRDISLNSTRSGTRLGNCGGNTNITFPAAKTVYWNLTGTQDWSATGWATTAGGTPAINNFPLAQDTATFTNTGALGTVTVGLGAWNIGTVDMSARTSAGTVGFGSATIYGNLTYGSGITPGGGGTFIQFAGRNTTQTITSAGKTLIDRLLIQAIGGTVRLGDALTLTTSTSGSVSVSNGTFNTQNFNLTAANSNNGFNTSGTATKVLTFGSSLITLAGTGGFSIGSATGTTITANTATVSLTSASAKTFAGAGLNFNGLTVNQGGAGALTISGSNTLANITNTYAQTGPTTITLTAGTTQTVNRLTMSGRSGAVLTLNTTGGTASLSRASGRIGVAYISMSNITATGGATWTAYNSTNVTGNTGWTFDAGSARFWVSGAETWNATAGTKWADSPANTAGGASVPTTSNDVYFPSGAQTVTISSGQSAKSLSCTGFSGVLTWSTGSTSLTVAGSIAYSSTMFTGTQGDILITGTGTIFTDGLTLCNDLTIDGAGITVTLASALTISGSLSVWQGTFTTSASNYAVTAAEFSITGTGTRTVTLNASTVTCTGSITAWDATTTTNLTFNRGTSTINISNANGSAFLGGGLTYTNVAFTSGNPNVDAIIDGANTFTQLSFTSPTSDGLITAEIRANQTITTLVCSGASAVRRIFLFSGTIGTARTLTVTTWSTISDVDFRDISMNTSRSGTRLGDCGGNTNITFPAAKTVYWNLGVSSRNWSAIGWAATSGGTPAVTNFPLAQDTAVFDNAGAITTLNIDDTWNVGSVNMSGRTSAMTFAPSGGSNLRIYGDFTAGSGVTFSSGTAAFYFEGRTNQNLTSAGRTFGQPLFIEKPAGSLILQDAFTTTVSSTAAIDLFDGTLDLNGFNATLSAGGFKSNYTLTRTLALGASTLSIALGWNTGTITNLTVTGTGTISMTGATAKTFTGGNVSLAGITLDQAGAGALTITGDNTFGNISNSYSATGATTIRLGGNQTVADFTATGEAGRVLTLNSNFAGTQRTLTKSTPGNVSVDYMSIQDIAAAGTGVTWYAGANSTNVSNNTGWIFTAPSTASGNFMMFFI